MKHVYGETSETPYQAYFSQKCDPNHHFNETLPRNFGETNYPIVCLNITQVNCLNPMKSQEALLKDVASRLNYTFDQVKDLIKDKDSIASQLYRKLYERMDRDQFGSLTSGEKPVGSPLGSEAYPDSS
jgi:hypothetical protein